MRRARDESKSELADSKLQSQSDLDEEKGKRRQVESEIEKMKFELSCKVEETGKEVRQREELGIEIQKLKETIRGSDALL